MNLTYNEIYELVKDKKVSHLIMKDGRKLRMFISTNEQLCYFKKGCSRVGYVFGNYSEHIFDIVESVVYTKQKSDKSKDLFNVINKYRKLALKSTFTNSFIKDCIALPETFEQWVQDGSKGLYESGITTGNKIDGKVITLDRIAKVYKREVEKFKSNFENKIAYTGSRVEIFGYEGTLAIHFSNDGEPIGTFSLEYKGCGNGYYYLLINDNSFIGYDVD